MSTLEQPRGRAGYSPPTPTALVLGVSGGYFLAGVAAAIREGSAARMFSGGPVELTVQAVGAFTGAALLLGWWQ